MDPAESDLAHELRERIASEGPLRFDAFMREALYHPQHGYYTSGRAQVGREGDFLTSPSISPLFGRLLARQAAELWEALGKPDPFRIIEQGAHHGQLMGDLIQAVASQHPDFGHAARWTVVEPAPALRREQHNRLGDGVGHVVAIKDLAPCPGIHLSNELLDAFPVRLVERTVDGTWIDLHVAIDPSGFALQPGSTRAELSTDCLDALALLPPGARTEIREGLGEWFADIARALPRGAVLTLDYGHSRAEYYRPGRLRGTLAAYRHHRRIESPLDGPGQTDLTAHVDFTALAGSARAAGFEVAGFADQHHFLLGLARADFARWEADPHDPRGTAERRALQTLTHPGVMGTDFHAALFTRGIDPSEEFSGFGLENRRSLLEPAPVTIRP